MLCSWSITISSSSSSSFALLFLLHFAGCSSAFDANYSDRSPEERKTIDITIHGVLLWASMGFLMPVGLLVIRMSNNTEEHHHSRAKIIFYIHAILQVLSVLLATAAAVLSIRSFENAFNNSHQRIGLALYLALYVQLLTGVRRPKRGSKGRSVWYLTHWLLGTMVSVVAVFNTYTGLKAYKIRTSKGTTLWTILFSGQVSFMAVLYLFQDKWSYIQKQGITTCENIEAEIITTDVPSSSVQVIPLQIQRGSKKEVLTDDQPGRKSNALGTYFSRSNALRKLFQLT